MRKGIILKLTKKEALAVKRAIEFGIDFSSDYFVFAPKKGTYNDGALKKDREFERKATKVLFMLDKEGIYDQKN